MPCWIFYQRFEALNSSKKPGASPHPTPLVLRALLDLVGSLSFSFLTPRKARKHVRFHCRRRLMGGHI
jgi:hypothetical protein